LKKDLWKTAQQKKDEESIASLLLSFRLMGVDVEKLANSISEKKSVAEGDVEKDLESNKKSELEEKMDDQFYKNLVALNTKDFYEDWKKKREEEDSVVVSHDQENDVEEIEAEPEKAQIGQASKCPKLEEDDKETIYKFTDDIFDKKQEVVVEKAAYLQLGGACTGSEIRIGVISFTKYGIDDIFMDIFKRCDVPNSVPKKVENLSVRKTETGMYAFFHFKGDKYCLKHTTTDNEWKLFSA